MSTAAEKAAELLSRAACDAMFSRNPVRVFANFVLTALCDLLMK
jgi:hypothetical protein